jgi:Ca-activated chloride channel family protein
VAAEAQPDVPVFAASTINPTVPVAPGRYLIEVREGPISVKQTAEVRDNRPAAVTMILNAGMARIRVVARKTGEALPDALVTATDANGALMLVSKTGEAMALLPAGRHMVRAELGTVRAEQSVTITAGRLFAVDMQLNAARLILTSSGFQAEVFSVLEDDPDAPDGRREVARSAAPNAEFVLPPGSYYAVARQGVAEARERLAIGPGDVVRRSLAVPTGSLALSTKLPAFGAGAEPHISYSVARIDNVPQDTVTTSQPSPTLLLPSGRYRVEGRYGLMNVRTVRDVDVKAGQTQQLVLEHDAAAVRLRVSGSGLADVSWIIFDQAGKTVWTGAHTEAVASLQAGSYTVRAETRSKRDERRVDLRAGEAKLLEFSVD